MKVIDRALPSKTIPKVSSAQNGKHRGRTAVGRNAPPTRAVAAPAEPPGEAAAPNSPNGAAREARLPSNGSGGDGAHARPNGAGASETSAEPVSGASSVLEDEADGRGAELEASPVVERARPADNAPLFEEPSEAAAPANFRAHLDEVSDTEITVRPRTCRSGLFCSSQRLRVARTTA
jgi:hypothetical protein